jgi:hypothetical protein
MTLDATGNLMLGATSNTTNGIFEVASANRTLAGGTGQIMAYSTNSQSADLGGQIVLGGGYSGTTPTTFAAISGRKENSTNANIAGYLSFGTSGSGVGMVERARIDSSGNLLVGQTTRSQTIVGAYLSSDGSTSSCMAASTNAATTWNTYSTGAGAYRFYVDMGGTVHATSIVITAISDERLKENVRDIDTGLSTVMALKPRRYDWKEGKGLDKKNAAGFIAQEFEQVLPDSVGTSKAGEDGIEYKNINYEELIPTLTKAIQEQQALITSLTERITALEAK